MDTSVETAMDTAMDTAMGLSMDPATHKAACRIGRLAARDALSPEERRAKSADIATRFLALPQLDALADDEVILLYAEHGTEVITSDLISELLKRCKLVALPVVVEDSPYLKIRRVHSVDELVRGAFGIRVPPEESEELGYDQVHLVVLPGVAFDPNGWRIGYGGGFYDRMLERSHAQTVGLAFDCQVLDVVPTECHDKRLGALVTETRVIVPEDDIA